MRESSQTSCAYPSRRGSLHESCGAVGCDGWGELFFSGGGRDLAQKTPHAPQYHMRAVAAEVVVIEPLCILWFSVDYGLDYGFGGACY